jgi:hypothetical protein
MAIGDVAPGMLYLTSRCCADIYADRPMSKPSPFYGGSYLLSTVQAVQQREQEAGGPHDELQQYLKAGVESTKDIIAWWGVSPTFYLI